MMIDNPIDRRDFFKKNVVGGVVSAAYSPRTGENIPIILHDSVKYQKQLSEPTSITNSFSPLETGAKFDGISDDTQAIQRWIDIASETGYVSGFWPSGVAIISNTLVWRSKVYAQGAGFGITIIRMKNGMNKNIVISQDFDDSGEIYDFGLKNISFDGSYFIGDHYAASPIIGNSKGDGIRIRGYSFDIEVEVNNVAGVGALFEKVKPRPGSPRDMPARLSFYGRIFGQEGLIMRGPGDHIIREAFVGASGLLPRPAAEHQMSRSIQYPGERVNGIVVDCNAEWGKIHTYAHWSGCGLVTLGNCRFQCEHLISESNLAQCHFKNQTYGAVSLISTRNLASLHPSWKIAIPEYSAFTPEFDAIRVDCSSFSVSNLRLERMSNTNKRVVGVGGLVINGDSNSFHMTSWRVKGGRGDIEEGKRLTGIDLHVRGKCNNIVIQIKDSQGMGGLDTGTANHITGTILNPYGIGFRATGANSRIELSIVGQKNDKFNDAAYSDGGSGNIWNVCGSNNENTCFSNAIPSATLISLLSQNRIVQITGNTLEITGFDKNVEIISDSNVDDFPPLIIRGGRQGQTINISSLRAGFLPSLDEQGRLILSKVKVDDSIKRIRTLYFDGEKWRIQQSG